MSKEKSFPHLVWGILLTIVGVVMFFSIPGKMKEIHEIKQYSEGMSGFLKISFYLISVMLTGGGLRKIFMNVESVRKD